MGKMAAALAHVFDTPVAIGASARPAIRRTLPFSDSTAAQATVQDFCRPELPELPAGPWLVSIDAPDGYTGWDDRTGRVRRPNPTRVRDAQRGLVCPHRTSEGGARPRYVVECFFFFSPELSCRRTQPHLVPSGERLGSTRKFIHFWFYFGSGCSPGWMGGDALSLSGATGYGIRV